MQYHDYKQKINGISKKEIPHIHVQLLNQEESLLPILSWIKHIQNKYKIENEEVIVGLDFDGTITNLNYKIIMDDIKEQQNEQENEKYKDKKNNKTDFDILRGGKSTKGFLLNLDQEHYKWFIFSARAYSIKEIRNISETLQNKMHLPFPPWFISEKEENTDNENDQKENSKCKIYSRILHYTNSIEKKKEEEEKTGKNNNGITFDGDKSNENVTSPTNFYKILQCYNIIGAIQSGSQYAFNKDVAMEYSIEKFFQRKGDQPKLIVFIDDNSDNINLLYQYFQNKYISKFNPQHPNIHFLLVFFYPQLDIRLNDALLRLRILKGWI